MYVTLTSAVEQCSFEKQVYGTGAAGALLTIRPCFSGSRKSFWEFMLL